jgi:hypothetical protein
MKRSITDFAAQLKTGGVRPTMFEVEVSLPDGNQNVGTGKNLQEIRQFTFLCKATQIPGSTVTAMTVGIPAGGAVKLPGSRLFEPWNVTVICDGEMKQRRMFEQWSESVIGFENQRSAQFLPTYMSTGTVYQLDRQAERIRAYEMRHLYPIVLAPMNLSYESYDQISSFDVQFVYHYFSPRQMYGAVI